MYAIVVWWIGSIMLTALIMYMWVDSVKLKLWRAERDAYWANKRAELYLKHLNSYFKEAKNPLPSTLSEYR